MKILTTILLALFISGQAYSENIFKTIKDLCKYTEINLTTYYDQIDTDLKLRHEALINENHEDVGKFEKRITKYTRFIKEDAPVYHYLDCSDFRSESGRIE